MSVLEVMSVRTGLLNQPSLIREHPLWNALLLTCILVWLIAVSVSGRPSGTDHGCAPNKLHSVKSIVVINVRNKIKNVKNAFFYPKNKKNVCKRDKKR